MRIAMVDPSAFTPPYDEALCGALAALGHDVELFTSRFAYAGVTSGGAHRVNETFYGLARGTAGSRRRQAAKLAGHLPDMLRLRRAAESFDVVHFQWLTVPALDRYLLPRRPLVLTAHDLLPREPRPGQVGAQRRLLRAMDAVIVHSRAGRDRLLSALGLVPERVHVVPHGAFAHLAALSPAPLPTELRDDGSPVALFFGLLRPYKGVAELLEAWRGIAGAQLWVVGHARMALAPLQAAAPPGVSFVPRFVSDAELAACFRRAQLVVLPYLRTDRYDQSGVLSTALAFGRPVLASELGGFGEIAATGAARLLPAGDVPALHRGLRSLLLDERTREEMAAAARRAAAGPFSWDAAARATAEIYAHLLD